MLCSALIGEAIIVSAIIGSNRNADTPKSEKAMPENCRERKTPHWEVDETHSQVQTDPQVAAARQSVCAGMSRLHRLIEV